MASVSGTSGTIRLCGKDFAITDWSLEVPDEEMPETGTVVGTTIEGATFSAVGELTPGTMAWLYELDHPDCWN